MTAEVDTLGDALPREMARVRDVVMPAYVSIGNAGAFARMSNVVDGMNPANNMYGCAPCPE